MLARVFVPAVRTSLRLNSFEINLVTTHSKVTIDYSISSKVAAL